MTFSKRLIELDESARELASLDELYDQLISSEAVDKNDLSIKKDEAKFARDRMLKLSLHIKNLVDNMSPRELK